MGLDLRRLRSKKDSRHDIWLFFGQILQMNAAFGLNSDEHAEHKQRIFMNFMQYYCQSCRMTADEL